MDSPVLDPVLYGPGPGVSPNFEATLTFNTWLKPLLFPHHRRAASPG